MLITILGSCRQDSLYNKYNITPIQNNISYPHYPKEIIQVINYCIYNNIKSSDTKIFRTPILRNQIIINNDYHDIIKKSDIYVIEIASRKYYKMNNLYVHHILYDDKKYNKNKANIITGEETDIEIEDDLNYIFKVLNKKKILVVGHLVTKNIGKRYELMKLVKKICRKNNIYFIDPIKELKNKNLNIEELIIDEDIIAHYNKKGHNEILSIYTKYINLLTNNN